MNIKTAKGNFSNGDKYNITHIFDKSILREYDVRGVVGETLSEKDCYFIGRSFGTILNRKSYKKLVIGYDGRKSSVAFTNEVIQGLRDSGIDVENIGLGPTPMVYFAIKSRNADAGIIITGSHSPIEFNGIKMALKTGPFYGADVQELGLIAESGDFTNGEGNLSEFDIQDIYVDRLLEAYEGDDSLTVSWDNGNGAAGEIIRLLTKKLPGKHILLFDEIDGSFPNHHPDPAVEENLKDLQNSVAENQSNIGVAFDGDADRFGAIDENGTIIWADILMAVYAADVLEENPNAEIIADVKSSRVLFDEIERLGGRPLMWNTGHSIIKAKMLETKAPLGGELSGHICFADKYYGFDDGLYCAVRMLNIISKRGKALSEMVAHLPKMHNTPEIRFHVPAERKFIIPKEIKTHLRKTNNKDVLINDVDGVRITRPEGWWLIRASNTEDLLTIRAESFTKEGLEVLKSQVIDQLKLSGIESPF